MPLTTHGANALLDALGNATAASIATPYLHLHTAYPTIVGTSNEVSGGTYTAQSLSCGAAASSAMSSDAALDFTLMPVCSVRWVSVQDAVSAGNSWLTGHLGGAMQSCVGRNTGDIFTCPAHGYSDTNQVAFFGSSLPAGITADTTYYVVSSTTDTFQVSTSSGGSAVTLTGDGSGSVFLDQHKSIANAGDTFSIASGDLDFSLI